MITWLRRYGLLGLVNGLWMSAILWTLIFLFIAFVRRHV